MLRREGRTSDVSIIVSMIAFIVAVIALIVAIPTLLFSGVSAELLSHYLRVFASGVALGFSIYLVRKNPNEFVYNLLAIAIGCLFLNDSYNFIHEVLIGDTGRYLINYLPLLGSLAFATSLNFQFMKMAGCTRRFLPLLAVIPAVFLAFLLWLLIGRAFLFPSFYLVILSIAFYTIAAMLMTKNRAFIFFEIVFIIHCLSAFFIIGDFTEYSGTLAAAIIELIIAVVPLMYIPAVKRGLMKCR